MLQLGSGGGSSRVFELSQRGERIDDVRCRLTGIRSSSSSHRAEQPRLTNSERFHRTSLFGSATAGMDEASRARLLGLRVKAVSKEAPGRAHREML